MRWLYKWRLRCLIGVLFTKLIGCGTAGLAAKVDEINALNVFPIPDGDTGENMYLTLSGGYAALTRSPSDEALEGG